MSALGDRVFWASLGAGAEGCGRHEAWHRPDANGPVVVSAALLGEQGLITRLVGVSLDALPQNQ
jgi:hypothetical protein